MAYSKNTWVNGSTQVNATNMNHIEQGIYDNSLKTDTIGDLANLETDTKTNIVSAINELKDGDIYSTAEIKTNKIWINNKPIYRKVIEKTTVADLNTISISSISNDIDLITDFYGITIQPTTNNITLADYYYNSTDYSHVYLNSSQDYIVIRCGSSFGFGQTKLVVEYTKSTD